MSETIVALTNSNVSGGMIIRLQKKGKHNPVLEATILFNALTEHLPGRTMTELYRQFVKSSRLFDPAAPDLLAACEQMYRAMMAMGNDLNWDMSDYGYAPPECPQMFPASFVEAMNAGKAAIATAKGE